MKHVQLKPIQDATAAV